MSSSTSAAPMLGPSRSFPTVVPPRELPLPPVADRTLPSGLRILAAHPGDPEDGTKWGMPVHTAALP